MAENQPLLIADSQLCSLGIPSKLFELNEIKEMIISGAAGVDAKRPTFRQLRKLQKHILDHGEKIYMSRV